MTFEDGLRELGISAETGGSLPADEVRRAYLRLLKTRRPETDPDGFRRLREAWESVRAVLAVRDAMAGGAAARDRAGDAATGGAGAADTAAPDAAAPDAAANVPAGDGAAPRPSAPPAPSEPPASSRFADFERRLAGLPEDSPWQARAAIIEEAVDEFPDDVAPRWTLARLLAACGRHDEAIAALRAGHARGMQGFLEVLVSEYPEKLTAAELDEARARTDPALRLLVAAAMARREDLGGGAEIAAATLAAATSPEPNPNLPAHAVLVLLLALHAGGRLDPAAQVLAAFRAWLEATGAESQVLGGPNGVVWAMVRDLAALPPEFPMMLRQAAATATLAGDIGQLANVGYHFALSFPGGVHTWALVLEERAPTLGGALRLDRAIPAAEAEAPRRTGFRLSGWSLVALAFLLVQIVRCLASDSSSVSRYSDTSYIPSPVTTTTPRSPFSSPSSSPSASSSSSLVNALSAGKPADPMQLAQARGMTDAICAAPRPIGNKACFHAEDLVRHLEHAHCTPARLTLMQYEIEINSWGSHAPRAAGRLETLVRRMVEHTCSGAAP